MARGLSGERIEIILLHNICNEIFLEFFINPPWSVLLPHINFFSFFSFSSCHNRQTFLIRLATFKITQILSPERASERKGMSTVEGFIWVNLYSLDLTWTNRKLIFVARNSVALLTHVLVAARRDVEPMIQSAQYGENECRCSQPF